MEQEYQERTVLTLSVSAKEKPNFLVEREKFLQEAAAATRQAERVAAISAELERLREEFEWLQRERRFLLEKLNRTAYEFGIGASPNLGKRAES